MFCPTRIKIIMTCENKNRLCRLRVSPHQSPYFLYHPWWFVLLLPLLTRCSYAIFDYDAFNLNILCMLVLGSLVNEFLKTQAYINRMLVVVWYSVKYIYISRTYRFYGFADVLIAQWRCLPNWSCVIFRGLVESRYEWHLTARQVKFCSGIDIHLT